MINEKAYASSTLHYRKFTISYRFHQKNEFNSYIILFTPKPLCILMRTFIRSYKPFTRTISLIHNGHSQPTSSAWVHCPRTQEGLVRLRLPAFVVLRPVVPVWWRWNSDRNAAPACNFHKESARCRCKRRHGAACPSAGFSLAFSFWQDANGHFYCGKLVKTCTRGAKGFAMFLNVFLCCKSKQLDWLNFMLLSFDSSRAVLNGGTKMWRVCTWRIPASQCKRANAQIISY